MPAAIIASAKPSPASDLGRRPGSDLSLLTLWVRRLRVRRELANLHDDQIREAGLDRRAVRTEADKPFWRS